MKTKIILELEIKISQSIEPQLVLIYDCNISCLHHDWFSQTSSCSNHNTVYLI